MPKAVILTALQLEFLAVRTHLSDVQEVVHPQGSVYDHGLFEVDDQTWEIGLVEVGMGNTRAAFETERAISHFNPQVAMFVGVAGGVKDVALGDVVVATKIYEYGRGKADEAFLPRTEIALPAYSLESRAKAIARNDSWQWRIVPQVPEPPPKAIVAPIAAGGQVVASNRSATFQFLRSQYNDATAVEMEGYGFLAAAQAAFGVHALVVRGISDLIEGKQESDDQGGQPKAASNAAAFAFEVLARFQKGQSPPPVDLAPRFKHAVSPASPTRISSLNVRGVAPSRLKMFSGRGAELKQIRETLLQEQSRGPKIMVIHALSGMGKTQLCREYLALHQATYELSYWISSGEATQAVSGLAQLAQDLEIPGIDPQDSAKSSRLAIKWLEQHDGWLLVFDNASPQLITPLLPSETDGHVLITSNVPHWGAITPNALRLEGLRLEDAVDFLLIRTGQTDSEIATRVARAFDSLPLALEQAAAYIETTGIHLHDYEDRLIDQRPDLLEDKSPFTDYPLSVYSAISLNVHTASESHPRTIEFLLFIAYMDSSGIPRSLVYDAMSAVFADLDLRFNNFVFDKLVTELAHRSLIVADSSAVSTHPLVQVFMLDSISAEVFAASSEFALGILARVFPDEVEDSTTWSQCETLIDHVITAAHKADLGDWDDEFIASLYNNAGSYLHARGREEQAYNLLRKVLDRRVVEFGGDDPLVAITSNNLMNVLAELGQIDDALDLGNRAISILTRDEETQKTYAVDLGKLLSNIGRLFLNRLRNPAAARTYIHRALAIHIDELGMDHHTVAIDINNLGTSYREEAYWANNSGLHHRSRKKWRSAYECFHVAVAIHRSAVALPDYRLGVTLLNLGNAALHLGLYTEAQKHLEEALKIYEPLEGTVPEWEHSDVWYYLGFTLERLGRSLESLACFDRALSIATAAEYSERVSVRAIQEARGGAAFQAISRFFCRYS